MALIPLGLVLIVAGALLVRRHPFVHYFLLAYLPFSQLLPEGIPLREVSVYLALSMFLATLWAEVSSGRGLRKLFWGDTLTKLVLAWYADMVLSYALSGMYGGWGARGLARMSSYVAYYFIFKAWLKNGRRVRMSWKILSWVILACAVVAVLQIASGGYTPIFAILYPEFDEPWYGRASGLIGAGPNALGGFLNLILPATLVFFATGRSAQRKLFYGAALCAGLIAEILSGSRSGLASSALTVILGIYTFTRSKKLRFLSLYAFVLALPVFLAATTILAPRITDVNKQESVLSRYRIWAASIATFQEHPVFGIGVGNLREIADPSEFGIEKQEDIDTSNLYLQSLVDTGVVGFAVFLTLSGYVLQMSWKNLKRYRVGSMAHTASFVLLTGMLSVLFQGTVDVLFIVSSAFATTFGVMLALTNAPLIEQFDVAPPKVLSLHPALGVAVGRTR